jgi:hypothetical protein
MCSFEKYGLLFTWIWLPCRPNPMGEEKGAWVNVFPKSYRRAAVDVYGQLHEFQSSTLA